LSGSDLRSCYHSYRYSQAGDGILIAGKGHEDYQILGTEKIHFDDREQARTALMEGKIDVTIAPYYASASAIQYSLKLDNMTQYGQTGLNFREPLTLYEQAQRGETSSTLPVVRLLFYHWLRL